MKAKQEVQQQLFPPTSIPVIKSKKEAPKKPARKFLFPKEALPVLFALTDYESDCEKRGGKIQAKVALWKFVRLMVPQMGKDPRICWGIDMKNCAAGLVYVYENEGGMPKMPDFTRGLLDRK